MLTICSHSVCHDNICQVLKSRRIAFMMAWHPRIGADAVISNFINKDIGRLIAEHYIHAFPHRPLKNRNVLIANTSNHLEILLEDVIEINDSCTKYEFSFVDHCLGYLSDTIYLNTCELMFLSQDEKGSFVVKINDWMRGPDFLSSLRFWDTAMESQLITRVESFQSHFMKIHVSRKDCKTVQVFNWRSKQHLGYLMQIQSYLLR